MGRRGYRYWAHSTSRPVGTSRRMRKNNKRYVADEMTCTLKAHLYTQNSIRLSPECKVVERSCDN